MKYRHLKNTLLSLVSGLPLKGEPEHTLEALAVDDGRSALVVLLLGNPHLLEGGQRSQDRSTDPDGVLSLRGSDDLDLHGGWRKGGDFLLHTVGDTGVHGGSTRLGMSVKVERNE